MTGPSGARHLVGNGNIRGHVLPRAKLLRNNRPHLRKVHHGGRQVPGEQVVSGLAVIGDLAMHRADDSHLVGDSGHPRKILTEMVTAFRPDNVKRSPVIRRCLRLGVPGFLNRESTRQVEMNNALGLRCLPGIGVGTQQVTQGKTKHTAHADLNGLAAVQLVKQRHSITRWSATKNEDTQYSKPLDRCSLFAPNPSTEPLSQLTAGPCYQPAWTAPPCQPGNLLLGRTAALAEFQLAAVGHDERKGPGTLRALAGVPDRPTCQS